MDNFWGSDQKLLRQFLAQNAWQKGLDDDSITSECDGEANNNQYCVQLMHDGNNPNLLLERVIIKKNFQFEIFKLMSQTKADKIKNRVKQMPQGPGIPRAPPLIEQIEERF